MTLPHTFTDDTKNISGPYGHVAKAFRLEQGRNAKKPYITIRRNEVFYVSITRTEIVIALA